MTVIVNGPIAVPAFVVAASVRVNDTSWNPLVAIDDPDPVDVKVTPVGRVPISAIVITWAEEPVFSMHAYCVCELGEVAELATGTDQLCVKPVSV